MDAPQLAPPPPPSGAFFFDSDNCAACHKQIGHDMESRRAYHPFRNVIFCGPCYKKGGFSARCLVCGGTEACAPMDHNYSKYVCRACQWSDHGRQAEQKSKSERRRHV